MEGSEVAAEQRRHRLHDGRVGVDGRGAEGTGPPGIVLDRHMAAQELRGDRIALHRPRRRRQGSGQAHFLPFARRRRHQDQLGVQVRQAIAGLTLFQGRVEHLPVPLLRWRQLERG